MIKLALQLARQAQNITSPNPAVGCVLVDARGEVIGQGQTQSAGKAHAEVMAIRLACKQLNTFQLQDCVLYSSCEPCPMCLGAIYWARLAKVYFACSRHDAAAANFDDSFIYDEISVLPHQRQIAMLHINLPTAMQPFDLWKLKTDKVVY